MMNDGTHDGVEAIVFGIFAALVIVLGTTFWIVTR
jgi:hypothetical protein